MNERPATRTPEKERPATRFDPRDADPLTVDEERPALTPTDDLRVSALAHYDRVSLAAGEWSNQVPQAIDHWYREHFRRRSSRWEPILAALIAGFLLGFVVASLSSRTEARAVQSPQEPSVWIAQRQSTARRIVDAEVAGSNLALGGYRAYGGSVSLSGWATYYDVASGHAAAGPALRTGDWRGRIVTVCAGECVIVRLTDWCACGSRHGVATLIDLARADFARLAPPSQGLVRVTVGPGVAPATDTAP